MVFYIYLNKNYEATNNVIKIEPYGILMSYSLVQGWKCF